MATKKGLLGTGAHDEKQLTAHNRLFDRLHGLIDDDLYARLTKRRGCFARVAVDTVGSIEILSSAKAVGANEPRVDGERERSIGESGVRADVIALVAVALEHLRVSRVRGAIVFLDRVNLRGASCPFAGKPLRYASKVCLIPAVIADE